MWTSCADLNAMDPIEIEPTSHTFVNDEANLTTFNDDSEWLPPSNYLQSLPREHGYGEPTFDNSATSASTSGTVLSSAFSTSDFASSMLPIIMRLLPKDSQLHTVLFKDARDIELAVRNMTSPAVAKFLMQQSTAVQISYVVLHRLVNDGTVSRTVDEPQTRFDFFLRTSIKYFFSIGTDTLKSIIDSSPSPYKLALTQNIFCVALVLGDGWILGLVSKIGPERLADRLVSVGDSSYYPLEYTSLRGDVQATRVLLNHGADPNRRKGSNFLSQIGRFPRGRQEDTEARLHILQLLIERGLKVNLGSVVDEMSFCDKAELLLLTKFYQDRSFDVFFRERGLPKVLLRPDWDDTFSEILRAILDRASPDISGHQELWRAVLSESLSSAVLRSNTSAVGVLLAKGATLDVNVLISAVRGNDLDILNRCLEHGLDPNARISEPIDGDVLEEDCTGLSESIKNSDGGAFELFRARGSIQNLARQPAGFVAAFVAACEVGDSILIEQLLSLQKLQRRQAGIGRALEAAIEGNKRHIVERLLFVGIKPTVRCLELAVRNKQLGTVKLLGECIDLPATLQADAWYYDHFVPAVDEQYYGNTIIFEALRWGDQTAIDYILRMEHPVNVVVNLAYSEFHEWDLSHELQPPGTSRAGWNLTPLSAAILKKNHRAMKALIAQGAQVVLPHMFNSRFTSCQFNAHLPRTTPCENNLEGWSLTPLAASVIANALPLVKELLYMGADPFDNSALLVSVILGLENVMDLLLSAFKDRYPRGAQSFGSDALYQAIRYHDMRIIERLARVVDICGRVTPDRKADRYQSLTPRGRTEFTSPIAEAMRNFSARNGNDEGVFESILRRVDDPDIIVHRDHSRGNMTPLLYAIFLGSLPIVEILHRARANISMETSWSVPQTPLQAAAQAEKREILDYLLSAKASPNECPATRAGATALQSAAMRGNIGIVTVLLEEGADINAGPAFFDGKTAFEGATEHGRIEMMLFLVHQGADLLADDSSQYRRAVQFAEDNLQYAAKELADELHAKAMASVGTSFIGKGDSGWTGFNMDDFTEFLA